MKQVKLLRAAPNVYKAEYKGVKLKDGCVLTLSLDPEDDGDFSIDFAFVSDLAYVGQEADALLPRLRTPKAVVSVMDRYDPEFCVDFEIWLAYGISALLLEEVEVEVVRDPDENEVRVILKQGAFETVADFVFDDELKTILDEVPLPDDVDEDDEE